MKVVIIGGVACGPKAAARIHRLRPDADIVIVEKNEILSYAGCGIPYYIGGDIKDIKELMKTNAGITRDTHYFRNFKGVHVLNKTVATGIDRASKSVQILSLERSEIRQIPYDKLVLATGSVPVLPPIPGADLKGVFCLRDLNDAKQIRQRVQKGVKRAVVIGGGAIGVEITEAFVNHDIETHIVEARPRILARSLDEDMSKLVFEYLELDEVHQHVQSKVLAFEGDMHGNVCKVRTATGDIETDLVVMAIGVRPNTLLAQQAGLELGETGAIKVNHFLQTSDPDIYAGGDCVENTHMLTDTPIYTPMGDTANKHGRVIGDNICGGDQATRFPGVLGTMIYKYSELTIGHSGLTEETAVEHGFEVETTLYAGLDKPEFLPSARRIDIKMVVDKPTRKLLGIQLVGEGDVSKRLDVAATAMSLGATIDQMSNMDLGYAPPYSPAIDSILSSSNVVQNKMNGVSHSLSPLEVHRLMSEGQDMVVLDVRTRGEFEAGHIDDPRVKWMSLVDLSSHAEELPRDKMVVVVCHVGLRSYEACQHLRSVGFEKAFFMEGGLSLWQPKMIAHKKDPHPVTEVEDDPEDVVREVAEA
jgi:NADPH-dependent 2,4-dienoyl-CoA reductase/sulfur reductase-like enzyme/rhodanese-related sulfurtransferase